MIEAEQQTEPVIGCCPCIKRMMVVIMIGTIVSGGLILQVVGDERAWDAIVESRKPFPSLNRPNTTFFYNKAVITKDLGPDMKFEKIVSAWKSLGRYHNFINIESLVILGLFLAGVLAHFTSFCCYREMCFLNKKFRILTYTVYIVGAAIFLGLGITLYSAHEQIRANFLAVSKDLEKLEGKGQFLYLRPPSLNDGNGTTPKELTVLTSSELRKICLMCYHNTDLTLMDMKDFRHVYPQNNPQLRIIKVGSEYYLVQDLVDLGFCQRDILNILNIMLTGAMTIVCLMLPVIGFFQMNRRVVKRKPKPIRYRNSLGAVHTELPLGLDSLNHVPDSDSETETSH